MIYAWRLSSCRSGGAPESTSYYDIYSGAEGALFLDLHDDRLDLALDGPRAEAVLDRFRRHLRRFLQRPTRLDLRAPWRALAVGDRHVLRRRAAALDRQRVHPGLAESRSLQIQLDCIAVVVAVRGALHELRRVLREKPRERVG